MNDMSEESFEQKMRERLGQWEAPSDPARWKALSGSLAASQYQQALRRQRWMLAAILLLLWPAGWGIWQFVRGQQTIAPPVAHAPSVLHDTLWLPTTPANTAVAAISPTQVSTDQITDPASGVGSSPSMPPATSEAIAPKYTIIYMLPPADPRELASESDAPAAAQAIDVAEQLALLQSQSGEIDYQMAWPEALIVPMTGEPETGETPLQRERNPWDLYVSAMPLMHYQRVTPNAEDEIFIASLDPLGAGSLNRLGYRVALGGEWQLNDWLSAQTELAYTLRRGTLSYQYHTGTPDSTIWTQTGETSLSYTPVFSTQSGQYYYRSHVLGLQIGLSALILDWGGEHRLLAGYEGGYLLQDEVFTLNGTEENITSQTPGHLVMLGYRYSRPLSDRWALLVQPSWRYSLGKGQATSQPLAIRPTSYGLSVGLRYRIGGQ